MKNLNKEIKVPYHLGIILDGNRRWAKERSLPTLEGHRKGYENVKKIGKLCKKKGVKILTVWAFSTENWNRSKEEVSYLMKLLAKALSKKEIAWVKEENIKLQVIGQKERLPKVFQGLIKEAEEETKNNKEGILNLAISYGGRPEILEAIKKIVDKKVSKDEITEDLIDKNLWTTGLPSPDLIIRTSGEQRTSGFLLWQSAYSELYFCNKNWPDFSEKDLDKAFDDFSKRKRNFGK